MVRVEHGSQRLPDADGRVFVMQVTTAGSIFGQINFQCSCSVFADQQQVSLPLTAPALSTRHRRGPACGCTDATATNYDDTAQYDDGSLSTTFLVVQTPTACNYDARRPAA